jgi:DNA-binding transcriptional MerR regulator
MTHLSVKTLRHYHQVALLEPVEIDAATGYRYYDTDQVTSAQVIRRLRSLDMPIDQVKAVLSAPDVRARNLLIADHLEQLENELAHTQAAVASLRSLISPAQAPIQVEHRTVAALSVVAITAIITLDDLGSWWSHAFSEIDDVLAFYDVRRAGPRGGLYGTELFLEEKGDAEVFVPVAAPVPDRGRVRSRVLAPAELAVALHRGPHDDIDQTYGALGSYAATHALTVEGRIRETYLVAEFDTPDAWRWQTEIGWPIFQTSTS